MKTLLIALTFATLSTSFAFAKSTNTYKCAVLNAEDEYSVEINLDSEKAAFFDNDNWSIVELQSINFLDTEPAQTEYTFSGKDKYNTQLIIIFNLGKPTLNAISYVVEGGTQNKDLECKKVKAKVLNSGI